MSDKVPRPCVKWILMQDIYIYIKKKSALTLTGLTGKGLNFLQKLEMLCFLFLRQS